MHTQQIEAYLFFKGEPVTIKEISHDLKITKEEVVDALQELERAHSETKRGIVLVQYDDVITLGTHPDTSDLITTLTKEELQRDLGKSALETLTIILYQGPITRSKIDHIRGVNSQFILRNLLMRGLISRVSDPSDDRSFVYTPSLDLLTHLGVSKIEDLPDFENVGTTLKRFIEGE
ncbi:MAG: SMC-Scp complex subunit ScpB [Patescibacteria group bacterium]